MVVKIFFLLFALSIGYAYGAIKDEVNEGSCVAEAKPADNLDVEWVKYW